MTSNATGLFVTIVIVGVLIGAVVFETQIAGPTSSTTTITTTQTSSASSSEGGLQLSMGASVHSNGSIQIRVSELNTLATSKNLSKADSWRVQGLSLGSCPAGVYPFGIAVFQGSYTSANASQGDALPVFPVVPCPLLLRLITGYLFLPMSDQAVILPSFSSNQTTPMAANMTLNGEYTQQGYSGNLVPFTPGVYTVVAGDEWGGLVVLHVTVGGSGSTSTTQVPQNGTLLGQISIGPTEPVCSANYTVGPASSQYSDILAVVSSSGRNVTTLSLNWLSNGCSVFASAQVSLAPGNYSLALSRCPFMGCTTSLPKTFTILPGQTTDVDVSIDTGIR